MDKELIAKIPKYGPVFVLPRPVVSIPNLHLQLPNLRVLDINRVGGLPNDLVTDSVTITAHIVNDGAAPAAACHVMLLLELASPSAAGGQMLNPPALYGRCPALDPSQIAEV